MVETFPNEEDILVKLFDKGSRVRWSSQDVDWDTPLQLTERQAQGLARMLTPVYLGEQTAMLGAADVIPQLMDAGEQNAQLYVTSFMVDEARHFEALTRLYARLEQDPIGLREMPEMLRYHTRLRKSKERADWVWGILISDLFAKTFYGVFMNAQPEALFGRMSGKILEDEARHQAFAEHYLRAAVKWMDERQRRNLIDMRDDLLDVMQAMYARLRADTAELNIDGDAFFERLISAIDLRVRRIGLLGDDDGGDGNGDDDLDDPYDDADALDGGPHGERGESSRANQGFTRLGERIPKAFLELRTFVRGLVKPELIVPGPGGGPGLDTADTTRSRARRHFHIPFGLAAGCTDCAIALLCKSRLMTAQVTP